MTRGCFIEFTEQSCGCVYLLADMNPYVWQNLAGDTIYIIYNKAPAAVKCGRETYSLHLHLPKEAADICEKAACTGLLTTMCMHFLYRALDTGGLWS